MTGHTTEDRPSTFQQALEDVRDGARRLMATASTVDATFCLRLAYQIWGDVRAENRVPGVGAGMCPPGGEGDSKDPSPDDLGAYKEE